MDAGAEPTVRFSGAPITAAERHRLRTGLHDALGPALAGIALQIEAARNLIRRAPHAGGATRSTLGEHAQAAIEEVREIVNGLRARLLDGPGPLGTLRGDAERVAPVTGLSISVAVPDHIPVRNGER